MCLILFAHKAHPRYTLVIAANRDESYCRPTAQAAFWDDHSHIYGGRDLTHGGTWLGVTLGGRVAAVTNFRDGYAIKTGTRSRGELVRNFLCGNMSAADYMREVSHDAAAFNGFNLLAGDLEEIYYFSNRGHQLTRVTPGIHGLSNHLLDTPWPKVTRGKQVLADLLQHDEPELIEGLFLLLADRVIAPDHALPDTGIGLHRERALSPAFIHSPTYGTRSSSVVLIGNDGCVTFGERSFGEHGVPGPEVTGRFALDPSALHPAAPT